MIKIYSNTQTASAKSEVFSLKTGAVINAKVVGKLSDTGFLLKYLNNTFHAKSDIPLKLNETLFLQVAESGRVTILKILNKKKGAPLFNLIKNLNLKTGISSDKLELLAKNKLPLDFSFLNKLKESGLTLADNKKFLFFARFLAMDKETRKNFWAKFKRGDFNFKKEEIPFLKKVLKEMTFSNVRNLLNALKEGGLTRETQDNLIKEFIFKKIEDYGAAGIFFTFFYEDELEIKDFKARRIRREDGVFIIHFSLNTQKFGSTDVYIYYTEKNIVKTLIISDKSAEIISEMEKSSFKFKDIIIFEERKTALFPSEEIKIKNIDLKI